MYTADRASASSATWLNTKSWGEIHAEPKFYADGYNYRIESCRAVWRRAPLCGFNRTVMDDYVRVDAVTYSNGTKSNNALYATSGKYTSCGSL